MTPQHEHPVSDQATDHVPAEVTAQKSTPASIKRPRVVVLGGGHGLATTIQAARLYAGELTAVVSVADDGGSSGRLRQIAGIPAPGDLRRCLVAMAAGGDPTGPGTWARAFEYRFPSGDRDLEGHALGNLLIAGLANVTGEFGQALRLASELLGTVGRVLPATSTPVVLKADVAGTEVLGQVNVSESPGVISGVSIVPPDATVPPEVLEAIAGADQVVIGPGSLFTSVLAVCVVPGIRSALEARHRSHRGDSGDSGGGGDRSSQHAPIGSLLQGQPHPPTVYVCNLRPQPPETAGFTPADHLRAVLSHGVPVDVMITHEPVPAQGPDGVRILQAPVGRPDGAGHDPRRLAAVLRRLT